VVFWNIDLVPLENLSHADGSVERFFTFFPSELDHIDGSLNPLDDFEDELAAFVESDDLAKGFRLNPDLVSAQE
jgi:hypothetical protein